MKTEINEWEKMIIRRSMLDKYSRCLALAYLGERIADPSLPVEKLIVRAEDAAEKIAKSIEDMGDVLGWDIPDSRLREFAESHHIHAAFLEKEEQV